METARVVALIGGFLILVGLLISFSIIYLFVSAGFEVNSLIPLGFFIDFICMLVLVFSDNALFLLVAGISATVSSFLLVGGVLGGIGGILGIVGSALMQGEGSSAASKHTLESRAASSSPPEQHFFRCPRCGYLNKADSAFCGQCRYPLTTEERLQA